jgi:sterol-4alpha-carboxylate 3-dehydrogenase (decarboxylating)
MFGPGDVQLLPPMLASYYRGQAKFQLGDNENLFDYTEITNIAHAHHLALAALLATHERTSAGGAIPLEHERVDGEAFLITNDQPVYFFDFARRCWAEMGDTTDPKSAWALSRDLSLFIAMMLEWIFWLLRKGEPTLTTQRVTYACVARYFNIDKAKRRLGYRPIVSLEEGIRRGVRDALYRGAIAGQPQEYKGNAEILKSGVPGRKVR